MIKKSLKKAKKIRVSIVCISFNHEKFILQTLKSFAGQVTDFDIEIIIGDDASTDRTQDIIRKFEKSYAGNMTSILRPTNIGVNKNLFDVMNTASGEYIALCEGDDYWTDPYKLQKQVEFLDANPRHAICFHPVSVVADNGRVKTVFPDEKKLDNNLTVEHLLSENYIQTNSVVYRNIKPYALVEDILPLDYYFHLLHARKGKIGFLNEVMAVYRHHNGGVWQNKALVWEKYGVSHMRMYDAIENLYPEVSYQKIIDEKRDKAIEEILWYAAENNFSINPVIEQYGGIVKAHVELHRENKIRIKKMNEKIMQSNQTITNQKNQIKMLKEQLGIATSSNSYRIGRKLTFPIRAAKYSKHLAAKKYVQTKNIRAIKKLIQQVYGLKIARGATNPEISLVIRSIEHPTSSTFIRLLSPISNMKRPPVIELVDGDKPKLSSKTKTVIVQRTALIDKQAAIKLVNFVRKHELKLCIDTDDAFHEIKPGHPQYELQKDRLEALSYTIENADGIMVSTKKLTSTMPKNKTVIVRNTIDAKIWGQLKGDQHIIEPRDFDKPLRMLYMGTKTHDGDFDIILPALDLLNDKYNGKFELTVVGVGSNIAKRSWLKVLSPESGLYPEFVHWLNLLPPFDIGLSPLEDSDFNAYKSDIKCLDYLAMGLKPVVSDVIAYQTKELDELIVRVGNSTEDWFIALEREVLNTKKNREQGARRIKRGYKYLLSDRASGHAAKELKKQIG